MRIRRAPHSRGRSKAGRPNSTRCSGRTSSGGYRGPNVFASCCPTAAAEGRPRRVRASRMAKPTLMGGAPNGSRLSCGASAGARKRPALRYELVGAQTNASPKSRPRQLQAHVRQHLPIDEARSSRGAAPESGGTHHRYSRGRGKEKEQDRRQPAWPANGSPDHAQHETEKARRDRHTQDSPPSIGYGIGSVGPAALPLVQSRVGSPSKGGAAESDDDIQQRGHEPDLTPVSVLPNGSRLSCGALKKDSFHNLRAPAASSAG